MRLALDPANAAFNAAAGTITFSTVIPASLSHVLRVINLTRAVTYFDPTGEMGDGYLGTATYASPVLTLQGIDTRGHANTDRLFIEYDDGSSGGGGGGGGGTGDASAAKQDQQTTQLTAINGDLGAPADAAASSDDGTFGVIPLLKRALQRITAIVGHVDGLEGSATSIDGKIAIPRTPTTSSVASSATSVTLLAANANRRGLSICNESTSTLRLSFSTPATAANSFMSIAGRASGLQPGFVMLDNQLIVAGAIYGIWDSANGTVQVTEYV